MKETNMNYFHGRMRVLVILITSGLGCALLLSLDGYLDESLKTMSYVSDNAHTGRYQAQDAQNNIVIITWRLLNQQTPEFNESLRNVSSVFIDAYVEQELDFAHKHPESVANEYFLKSLAPLFESPHHTIDWSIVTEEIKKIVTAFFMTTNFVGFIGENDTTFLVEVHDQKTHKRLGALQFLMSPQFEEHAVRACFYGVDSQEKERGIELLLMSSLFLIAPDTRRIFLHTRATNERMLALYHAWGFDVFSYAQPNWPDLEYQVHNSSLLQVQARTCLLISG